MLTRRQWVCTAAGAGLCSVVATGLSAALLAAAGFWNKKDPDAWTDDEILQLATRSPWAVQARILPKPGRDRGGIQLAAPEIAGGRSGGRGTGPDPVVRVAEVTVVWESARPLLDALKSHFPADFANHYVIGVNDLPRGKGIVVENMRASLQAHGRDSVGAGAVEQSRDGRVLFAFSRELLPLGAKDRDVLFILDTDQFSVKARFEPKEMIYRGMPAL